MVSNIYVQTGGALLATRCIAQNRRACGGGPPPRGGGPPRIGIWMPGAPRMGFGG